MNERRLIMERKKFLSLIIFGLFLVSLVSAAGSVGGSQEGVFVSLWKAFFGGIEGIGTDGIADFLINKLGLTGAENASIVDFIAFFLLVILVGMLIYDVAGMLPFFNKGWSRPIFSVIFAILAFLFFDMTQIKYLLSSYQAVGITLVAIVPFIVIWAFVWNLNKKAEDEVKPSYEIFGTLIWIFFAVYLILRWTELLNTTPVNAGGNIIIKAYLAFAVVAGGLAFSHTRLYSWIAKRSRRTVRDLGIKKGERNQVRALRNRLQEIQDAMRNPENSDNIERLEELQKEADGLRRAIRTLEG